MPQETFTPKTKDELGDIKEVAPGFSELVRDTYELEFLIEERLATLPRVPVIFQRINYALAVGWANYSPISLNPFNIFESLNEVIERKWLHYFSEASNDLVKRFNELANSPKIRELKKGLSDKSWEDICNLHLFFSWYERALIATKPARKTNIASGIERFSVSGLKDDLAHELDISERSYREKLRRVSTEGEIPAGSSTDYNLHMSLDELQSNFPLTAMYRK